MGSSWSYFCCCSGVNSTLVLLDVSISMSLAGTKASSAPGYLFPGFLGHGKQKEVKLNKPLRKEKSGIY